MQPKELVFQWVEAFNKGDAALISEFYADDAINHQVAESPVAGKAAIKEMFKREFSQADMTCIVENIFEDGEWAILEWKDPLGLRGCGFFHVQNGKIIFPARLLGQTVIFKNAQVAHTDEITLVQSGENN